MAGNGIASEAYKNFLHFLLVDDASSPAGLDSLSEGVEGFEICRRILVRDRCHFSLKQTVSAKAVEVAVGKGLSRRGKPSCARAGHCNPVRFIVFFRLVDSLRLLH